MTNKKIAPVLVEAGFVFDTELDIWIEINREKFDYNDGDEFENYILDVVSNASDCSVMSPELATKIKDWPSLYHLTSKRSNLLRPFAKDFAGKRILEIGSGCGAITRFLGESGAHVTAIEGSLRRATIARKRCAGMDNIDVICASSEKIPDLGEFDYVMLIGVLEYANSFLGKGGQKKLLESCRTRLTRQGALFIAIENKLGLKYLAGAKEDHLGVPMLGINNAYSENGVCTLGREELKDLIRESGYHHIEEYLPFPDYKLPTLIFTPSGHQYKGKILYPLVSEIFHKEAQPSSDYTFSLEEAAVSVWKNNISADLANSFLMVVSSVEQHNDDPYTLAWYYSESRKDNRQKTIQFYTEDENVKVNVFRMNGEFVQSENYYQGESLWLSLVGIMNKHGWQRQQIVEWVRSWIAILIPEVANNAYTWDYKLKPEYLDATPFNIIKTDAGYKIFDLELKAESELNLSTLIFRGLLHSFLRITSVSPTHEINDYNIYQLTKAIIADVFPDAKESLAESCLREEVELMRQIATVDTTALYENYQKASFIVRNFLNDYRIALASLNNAIIENESKIAIHERNENLFEESLKENDLKAEEFAIIHQEYEKNITELKGKEEELAKYKEENSIMKGKLQTTNAQLNDILSSRGWKMLNSVRKLTSKFKR
ncbi:class I SAM-dependent methyltransferase [Pantoea piersonii]|uniref:class I SAM-dependent methyltransferase n=1 Tax=Pantoea piersonii TaxID=2364647 RepID=UPI0022F16872|nr:class I SAM-dependent methyltransferase [Pantoea piersonii]WBV22801.1 class I SAM-dependent methyltransferase [Pantoea piersonii]